MRLFVDDIRNAPDDTWHVARTSLEAIRAISRYDFDVISLDHDISHQVSIGNGLERPFPCGETFASVAYYIAEKYRGRCLLDTPEKTPHIIIHSSNLVAGEEMKEVLHDAGFSQIDHVPAHAANRLEMEV